ncbi:phosphatase PAP2 family protein [Janibacter limosus]|uniref:phosphatase PAP2 family protein n=1 Tax=Janibacter limosus TaxID=53458 RepID=UPI0035DFD554|nr:phosphatase PAP2 family protein [Janibacter limosus]
MSCRPPHVWSSPSPCSSPSCWWRDGGWPWGGGLSSRGALLVPLVSIPLARWLRVSLPRPDHGYSYVDNTMPSTHATVVVAAVVAVAMMWPSQRPAWLGWCLGGVVAMACPGNVVGHAHRPSDVLASVLLVIAVAGVVRGLSARLARRDRGW